MNVLIDAHMLGEQETGNETYIANLLRGFAQLPGKDTFVVAAAHRAHAAALVGDDPRFAIERVASNPVRRLGWDLPRLVQTARPDVMYVSYTGPARAACPVVVAVHDVSYKRHPSWFSPRDRVVLTAGVGVTIRRARAVVTLSEFSRREIAHFYPSAAKRIHAIHLAPGPEFTPTADPADETVLARFGITRPYVLAVGNLQPRKNLLKLVRAFGSLPRLDEIPHQLVLTGKSAWRGSAVDDAIVRGNLSRRVIKTGYVPAEALPALYRGADLFAYPSLYEGFGIPVLEAMASGTPVLASSTTAVGEVAGDAARLVNPESAEELTAALHELIVSAAVRERLRHKGLARSRRFSWAQTARRTMDVLGEAAAK